MLIKWKKTTYNKLLDMNKCTTLLCYIIYVVLYIYNSKMESSENNSNESKHVLYRFKIKFHAIFIELTSASLSIYCKLKRAVKTRTVLYTWFLVASFDGRLKTNTVWDLFYTWSFHGHS